MFSNKPINIFYDEPDVDRWVKYDRYPRKFIRRLLRGKERAGGQKMIVLGLMRGLDKLNIPYRFNDYSYIKKNPDETACIIGKPHLLFEREWKNPIIFGAGIYSHPIECPELLEKYPNIRRVLVPGEWMRKMFEPSYGDKVISWPTGIDTNEWNITDPNKKKDILIYDKIHWERDKYCTELMVPIVKMLDQKGLSHQLIKYGHYTHPELKARLATSKAAIFLSAHETQGLAYQQTLATGTPIFAWDRGGYWEDPSYYPGVKFQPVSSVPYWDERCGMKFKDINEFEKQFDTFLNLIGTFKPRDYILNNLTLEKCASAYLKIYEEVESELV